MPEFRAVVDTNVVVGDVIPAGTTFVSVTTSIGNVCTGGAVITCNLGTMQVGDEVTITLVTTPTVEGQITNTVSVASASPPDPNTANNTATATTTVQP